MQEISHLIDFKDNLYSEKLLSSLRFNRYAILKNHSVNLDKLNLIYEEWSSFFENSVDYKQQYLYSAETDDGYVPMNLEYAKDVKKPDLKEFYQIHLDGLLNQVNPCSVETKKLFLQLTQLGESLIEILDNALPANVKNSMAAPLWASMHDSKRHCMRFIHYPPCGDLNELYRSAPHDDICLLTIILPARGEGLMIKKNNIWEKENAENTSLVVFNSEMLEICTQGYFQSMSHYVTTDQVDAKNMSRYSMPFAVHPCSDMLLKEGLTAHNAVRQRIVDTQLNKIKEFI
jgi:isopenicillin N synthase-like dioxygenase